jgi:putative polymerase
MRIERHSAKPGRRPFEGNSLLSPPLLLVMAATLFNAMLAFVNAHGVSVGKGLVIACEFLVTAGACFVVARHWSRSMLPWALLLGALTLQFLVLSVAKQDLDPKLLRDVAIIPIFVMLGMTAARLNLVRFLIVMQTIVLLIMIFEGAMPGTFGTVFNVTKYYVNTRGFSEDSFWMKDTGLFVSSFRPGDRFLFKSLDIHRLSSVFLEPVSLGNYVVIMVALVAALWRDFSVPALAYMAFTSFLLLVGCDGRQATLQCGLILLIMAAHPFLPRVATAAILPLTVGLAFAAVIGLDLVYTGDDFTGRIVYSVNLISDFDVARLLGFYAGDIGKTFDSGLAYFVVTHSIIGVAAIWFTVVFCAEAEDRASRIYLNSLCLYWALSLLVSNAAFSVKTAALLWFGLGYVNERAALRLRQHSAYRTARQTLQMTSPFHTSRLPDRPMKDQLRA